MEDFGYSKEQEENYASKLIKRAFLIAATLFSIACFGYITFSAYYFFSQSNGEIKIIEPAANPIKVFENEEEISQNSIKIDASIYEDIFGTKNQQSQNVKVQEVAQTAVAPPQIKVEENVEENVKNDNKKQKIIIYSAQNKEENNQIVEEKKPEIKEKKSIKVQIAAMTSKTLAKQYFERLSNQHPSLFSGLNHYIQEVDLGKRGIFYRVQIGSFYDQIRAENFCKKFINQTNKTRSDCIIVE